MIAGAMVAAARAELRRGIIGERWPTALATLLLLAAGYATSLLYGPLNHGPSRIFLGTAWDRAIPLVPVFVLPYVSLPPYIAVSMALLLLLRARLFRSAAVAMIIAWLVSYTFYLVLQSYVDRPTLAGTDPLTALIRTVYASDRPYNDFPSLHTSLATIIAVHWWRVGRRAGIVGSLWTLLIVASTVLIHQHYLADVAGGLVLASLACTVSLHLLAGGTPYPAGDLEVSASVSL